MTKEFSEIGLDLGEYQTLSNLTVRSTFVKILENEFGKFIITIRGVDPKTPAIESWFRSVYRWIRTNGTGGKVSQTYWNCTSSVKYSLNDNTMKAFALGINRITEPFPSSRFSFATLLPNFESFLKTIDKNSYFVAVSDYLGFGVDSLNFSSLYHFKEKSYSNSVELIDEINSTNLKRFTKILALYNNYLIFNELQFLLNLVIQTIKEPGFDKLINSIDEAYVVAREIQSYSSWFLKLRIYWGSPDLYDEYRKRSQACHEEIYKFTLLLVKKSNYYEKKLNKEGNHVSAIEESNGRELTKHRINVLDRIVKILEDNNLNKEDILGIFKSGESQLLFT